MAEPAPPAPTKSARIPRGSIPFARAVGRIDVAMGMYPERTFDVSLGGQQFF